MTTYTVNLKPALELTDEQFWRICIANRDLKFERSAAGELIIMPPTGGTTGNRNSRLNQQLGNWADQDGTGLVFDYRQGSNYLMVQIDHPMQLGFVRNAGMH